MKTRSQEMHELYLLNKKEEQEKAIRESFLKKKEEQEKEKSIIESFDNKAKMIAKRNELSNFLSKVKPSLLVEAINFIAVKAMPYAEDRERELCKGMIREYVENVSAEDLLSSFKTTSYILSEYANIIEEAYDNIRIRCSNEGTDLTIEPEDRDEFFDNLDTEDAEQVAIVIRNRVSNATDEFIEKNAEDKMNIKDILTAAQQKIDSANDIEVKESFDFGAKRRIQQIRDNRPKGIYEFMIYRLANKSFKDENLKKQYVNENKLDMDSVTTDCEVLYTVMETLNTLKIQKFDKDYVIESIVKNF